jgi:hypothetical protein
VDGPPLIYPVTTWLRVPGKLQRMGSSKALELAFPSFEAMYEQISLAPNMIFRLPWYFVGERAQPANSVEFGDSASRTFRVTSLNCEV